MPDPFRQGGSNRKASLTIFMNRRLSSVPSSGLSLSRSPLNPPKSMHPWLAATSDSMMVLTMSLMADSASETLFPFPKRKCSAGERLESHRLDNRQATFFCPKMSTSKRRTLREDGHRRHGTYDGTGTQDYKLIAAAMRGWWIDP